MKLKLMLKRTLVILMIIFVLFPTLFSGYAFAETDGNLNTERAGNFAANFAINFYENWSSINVVNTGTSAGNGSFNMPLEEGTYGTSSPFADSRIINGVVNVHNGMDFAAPEGTPVYSSADGEVINIYDGINDDSVGGSWGQGDGYGNHIAIKTGEVAVLYGHLLTTTGSLSVGSHVKQGQQIGKVGTTGNSTGYHLHFEFMTNNVSGLTEGQYMSHSYLGYSYSADPMAYIEKQSSSSRIRTSTYGEIRTEYDETVDPTSQVEEELASGENYKFNNLSWIGFVYSNSLFNKNINKILKGTGDISINDSCFDDKTKIEYVKEDAKNSDTINVSKLISEGRILPGDILYAVNGQGGGEYLLYVGGTKIIYATGDELNGPSGALKYEYLEYYLKRTRARLTEGHEDDANFTIPKYGITEVYRINKDTAESIPEFNANLIFNGKGYYTVSDYEGIASEVSLTETHFSLIKWLFDAFKQLINFFISLIFYIIRMQIVGWANLFENLAQHIVLGLSGDTSSTSMWDGLFGTNATAASGDRVTVESIFFNEIPILDANFFDTEHAGGHDLKVETSEQAVNGQEQAQSVNVVVMLRENLRTMYRVIRNLSIALLLFALLFMGIKIAISSSAEKKAKYKSLLLSWFIAMLVVVFIHLFMYAIFQINETFVDMCRDWGKNAANQEVSGLLSHSQYQEELSLYDAIRIKAYVFNWKEGVPATIIYVYMVYLMIRFLLIYFKRYLTIYILALAGSFMGVKYAFDKMLGRKTTSLGKWMKDFAFNVLLQTVHAFIYVLFMAVALAVSQESLGGALIALVILNFMLKADSIIIQIFGLNSAGSLADVNRPESWSHIIKEFFPIFTISRGAANLTKGVFFGKRGIVTEARLFTTGKDNMRDAFKELEKRKYNRIGWLARNIDKTPIRHLFRYNEYNKLLGKNLSSDTNKKLYTAIKQAKTLNRKKFTRKVAVLKDLSLGTVGTVASMAVGIENPSAGLTMFVASRKNLKGYKSPGKSYYKADIVGIKAKEAKKLKNEAKKTYNFALNRYTNNEFDYQEKYRELLDQYRGTQEGSTESDNLKESIRELRKLRRKERAKELHALQEADEALNEAKIDYGNAKHEHNHKYIKVPEKVKGFVEDVTGLSRIEEMAKNDARAQFKAFDSSSKQDAKLKDLAKVAKLEQEVRTLTKELKKKYDAIAKDEGNDISKEMSKAMFEKDVAKTVKASDKVNVTSSQINRAITEYLLQHRTEKVTDGDIDAVLDNLQEILRKSHKNVTITDELKDIVRKDFEEKMISENKGLGLDSKDSITSIRKSLSKEKILPRINDFEITRKNINSQELNEITELHNRILHKLDEINTYNQIGKVKHKGALVSKQKIIKEAKKQ